MLSVLPCSGKDNILEKICSHNSRNITLLIIALKVIMEVNAKGNPGKRWFPQFFHLLKLYLSCRAIAKYVQGLMECHFLVRSKTIAIMKLKLLNLSYKGPLALYLS